MPAGERRFGQAHALARFEESRRLGLNRRLLRPQGLDQRVGHLGRLYPEADDPTDAFDRTDRRPTWGRIALAQADEKVERKQGFVHNCQHALAELF